MKKKDFTRKTDNKGSEYPCATNNIVFIKLHKAINL